jgi:tRNA pseudouridine38-40 synthase
MQNFAMSHYPTEKKGGFFKLEQKKRRILLRVAYDGTRYHGWQIQPKDDTIEGELNKALSRLTGEEIQVVGASRTDAGVHAQGNVAVFDTVSKIPPEKFSYALNPFLPPDIAVQESTEVAADFHPRHCDCIKTYEYHILNRRVPLPCYRDTSFFFHGTLDVDAMKKACPYVVGEHDFASFCAAGAQVQTTVRTIYDLEIFVTELGRATKAALPEAVDTAFPVRIENAPNRMITIRVRGNGFLYNMVRIIAGTLLEVGKGRIQPEEMAEIIQACDREKAGPTAPAKGLELVEIAYLSPQE